jgi:Trypsin-like peptidase domain
MTAPAAPIEIEHHILPIVRYAGTSAGAGPVAVAGTGFTLGEGTLVTCWHCVRYPLDPNELYGVAVRRGGIDSPYEFCSIDNLGQDDNGADLALGRVDWTPGRVLTLADGEVHWGERVETYGYPFPAAVPDEAYPDHKALKFYPRFLRGYVTQLTVDESTKRPVMELEMLCPPGLSGAPVIREDRREVIGVVFDEHTTTMSDRTVIFGRAHHLDVLRAARGIATRGRALADYLQL